MNDPPPFDAQAFKDFEHAGWEAAAAHYHDLFGETTSQFADHLLDAVGINPGVRMLEVACGAGRVSAVAHARGVMVTGIDFSAAMIAEARRRYPEIEFLEGDAEALPFKEGSFDAAVCNFGLHHFSHPDRAVEEIARVLLPGGRFAFTAWSEKASHGQLARDAIQKYGDPNNAHLPSSPFGRFNDPKFCEAFLQAGGFTELEFSEIPGVMRCAKGEDAVQVMYKSTVGTRARLESQSPQVREKIDRAIAEEVTRYKKEGVILIPMPAVMAVAQKN